MLVISRRPGEEIMIGDEVIIKILEFRSGGKIRLGITAPKEVDVHRGEVYDIIHRNDLALHAHDIGGEG